MAQFRAIIKGQRGAASRLGSKKSGILARIDGWNNGIAVSAEHINGKDVFSGYRTGGSNDSRFLKKLAEVE